MKHILLLLIIILTTNSAYTQSKREKKQFLKHQEMIGKTTKEDGSRYFTIKSWGKLVSDSIRFDVKNCTRNSDGTISIKMTAWNNSNKDNQLVLIGNNVYTEAIDEKDIKYKGFQNENYLFEIKGQGRADGKSYVVTDKLFIPAGTLIQVDLIVKKYNKGSKMFKELSFAYSSTNYSGVIRKAHTVELIISD